MQGLHLLLFFSLSISPSGGLLFFFYIIFICSSVHKQLEEKWSLNAHWRCARRLPKI